MSASKKPRVTVGGLNDYDSDFEDDEVDEERRERKAKRQDLTDKELPGTSQPVSNYAAGLPTKGDFETARSKADAYKYSYLSLNAFERHKKLINDYYLYYPGSKNLLQRDGSKDKNDYDIIREHHRFIWSDGDDPDTWERQMAKKYHDKLFKEYCICDMSLYQQKKYAMRWRTETEVINGKGQFICGGRKCDKSDNLRSWEVNFAYMEDSVKKNALVKLRLCPDCSVKLNYHQRRKDVTKIIKKKKKRKQEKKRTKESDDESLTQVKNEPIDESSPTTDAAAENIWKEPVPITDVKSREDEFDEYLDDLFL